MACPHNQAKINALNAEIDALEQDISDLEKNIEIYKKTQKDYCSLNDKMICVMNNLEENHISAGESYGNSDINNILKNIASQVSEIGNLIGECRDEINSIDEQIAAKKTEIDGLQGDCSSCQAAKYAALSLKERQQHS